MRAVVQRVKTAAVSVDDTEIGRIGPGLLIFLGVGHGDTEANADWLARKISSLRIFDDDSGKMNRSIVDIGGNALVISQFTLFGSVRKGSRPSFNDAAHPNFALPLYHYFNSALSSTIGRPVATGRFGAYMSITAENDGPVTLVIEYPLTPQQPTPPSTNTP